uniref:Uncharacterized protein n=1 Tax=Sphaerodactylus townsendi TaxID=933632 RepID=A0ACB8F1R8_9SAUR
MARSVMRGPELTFDSLGYTRSHLFLNQIIGPPKAVLTSRRHRNKECGSIFGYSYDGSRIRFDLEFSQSNDLECVFNECPTRPVSVSLPPALDLKSAGRHALRPTHRHLSQKKQKKKRCRALDRSFSGRFEDVYQLQDEILGRGPKSRPVLTLITNKGICSEEYGFKAEWTPEVTSCPT